MVSSLCSRVSSRQHRQKMRESSEQSGQTVGAFITPESLARWSSPDTSPFSFQHCNRNKIQTHANALHPLQFSHQTRCMGLSQNRNPQNWWLSLRISFKALDKRTSGDTEGTRIWGDSLGAISHIKLSQGAFRGNPPVSLVPPVSLLVGFPESHPKKIPSNKNTPLCRSQACIGKTQAGGLHLNLPASKSMAWPSPLEPVPRDGFLVWLW